MEIVKITFVNYSELHVMLNPNVRSVELNGYTVEQFERKKFFNVHPFYYNKLAPIFSSMFTMLIVNYIEL